MPEEIGLNVLLLVAGLVVGALAALWLGRGATRARELSAQVEQLSKERDLMRDEVDSVQAELRHARGELERYRGQVAEHFTGVSDRLRELTLQYRSVYDHLTEGARTLCPEGFREIEGGLRAAALAAPPGEAETGGAEARATAPGTPAESAPAAPEAGAQAPDTGAAASDTPSREDAERAGGTPDRPPQM